MKIFCWIEMLACLLLSVASTSAHDLRKIERQIVHEPTYASKPKYCLLVFGPDAETRMWVVLDGNVLFVDRNGNGDLTDADERVAANNSDGANAADGNLLFEAGEVRAGKLTHRNLIVSVGKLDAIAEQYEQVKELLAVDPQARGFSVMAEVEMPGWKGAGVGGRVEQQAAIGDAHGLLKFADQPQDAPIIHFGGPWQITLYGPSRLTVGRTTDLVLGVGTPGLGAGTTAFIAYEGVIPEKVYPTVEVTYPSARKGDAPVKELYELKERC